MSEAVKVAWRRIRLGGLARKLVNGGTPPTDVARFWNGGYPWITGADFTEAGIGTIRRFVSDDAIAQTATNLIDQGQLLIVTRTGVGKLAIAPTRIAISQDITGFYCDSDQVDTVFLYHRLKLALEDLKKLNQGTSISGITRSDLTGHFLDLPPLPHQRRIAEILTTLDEEIEAAEALIGKYQQIKAGLMHDLFTRGLWTQAEIDRGDHKGTPLEATAKPGQLRPTAQQAPQLYKQSPLGSIPKAWRIDTIGAVFEIQLGKMLNKLAKTGKYSALYLGNRSVQWDRVDLSAVEEMDFSPAEREKFNLKYGDLLVCEGGDVGRTAMWRAEIENCFYQKAIHRLRPIKDEVVPALMLRYMRFAKNSGRFSDFTSQSSIAHLTQEKLGSIPILIPARREQDQIVSCFDGIDDEINIETIRLAKLREQKQGLMHDLLTGRVRVGTREGGE